MKEILMQTGVELSVFFDSVKQMYVANVGGERRCFETIEQAVEWACAVRDGGRSK